jgi:hypothetical protein
MSKALYRQIIVDARDLIAVERRWIQNARAITRGRDRIEAHHPRAKRFCAMGAVERAAFSLTGDVARAELLARAACESLCGCQKRCLRTRAHKRQTGTRERPQALRRLPGLSAPLKLHLFVVVPEPARLPVKGDRSSAAQRRNPLTGRSSAPVTLGIPSDRLPSTAQ